MDRRINGIVVENPDTSKGSSLLPDAFHHQTSKEKGRFRRALTFLVLIGTVIKAIMRKPLADDSPDSNDERRRSNMSTSAAAAEESRNDNGNGNGDRSILKTVLEQKNDSVQSDTDDLFDRASTSGQAAFRREFDNKVTSLKGFNNSIKDLVKGK